MGRDIYYAFDLIILEEEARQLLQGRMKDSCPNLTDEAIAKLTEPQIQRITADKYMSAYQKAQHFLRLIRRLSNGNQNTIR